MRKRMILGAFLIAALTAACSGPVQRAPGTTTSSNGDPPSAGDSPPSGDSPAATAPTVAAAPPGPDRRLQGLLGLGDITVARVMLGLPTPPARTPQPLRPEATPDRTVLTKLLGWLAAATVVDGEIHAPGRSPTLVLERPDGSSISLRLAYDCVITRGPDSTRQQCRAAAGQVILTGAGPVPLRLNAPDLFAWLQDGWERDVRFGTGAADRVRAQG